MEARDINMLFEAYKNVVKEDLGLGPEAKSSPEAGITDISTKIIKAKQEACPCNSENEECGCNNSHESNVEMAKGQLYDAALHAASLYNLVGSMGELEPWIASKITTASDYLNSIKHYLDHKEVEAGVEVKTEDNEEMASAIERGGSDIVSSIRALLSRESKQSLEKILVEVINIYENK